MWIVKYETHFKYLKDHEEEHEFKYYIPALLCYYFCQMRFILNPMPVRHLSLVYKKDNILRVKKVDFVNLKQFRRLKYRRRK